MQGGMVAMLSAEFAGNLYRVTVEPDYNVSFARKVHRFIAKDETDLRKQVHAWDRPAKGTISKIVNEGPVYY